MSSLGSEIKSGLMQLDAVRFILGWWEMRAPRERRILLGGAVVLGVALVYALFWDPAASGIKKLEADLPALRSQRGVMLALAEEARQLREATQGRSQTVIPPDQRRGALERSLGRAGWSKLEIGIDNDGHQTVKWADVDYAAWVAWVAGLERELGVHVVRIVVQASSTGDGAGAAPAGKAAAPPGHVRAELALDWAQAPQAGQ